MRTLTKFMPGVGTSPSVAENTRPCYLIGLAVLLPVCILQICWTRFDFGLLLDHLLNDDAFYYLQVVRNIADHGRMSFDGLNVTTGIQPLWTALLVPLAVAIDDRVELVRWVLVLAVLLNGAAGLMLTRVAVALSATQLSAVFTAVLWAGYMLAGRPALMGMESGLVALTFASFIAFIALRPPPRNPTWGWRVTFAALIAALFLSRTESLLLVAPLGGFVVAMHRRSAHSWRPALLNGALVAGMSFLLVIPYLVLNLAVSGQLMPVSGSVKIWYAAQHLSGESFLALESLREAADRVIEIVNRGASITLRPLSTFARLVDFQFGWVIRLGGLLLAVLAAAYALDGATRRFFLVLGIAGALHVLSLTLFLGVFSTSIWYYVPEYAAACLFLGITLARLAGPRRASASIMTAAVAVMLIVHAGWIHSRIATPAPGLNQARYLLAQEISTTLPPDAVIGSWNAGHLGYFSSQRVINLDGLVNDAEYLSFLRAGGDVRDYIRDEGITYVADYNAADLRLPRPYSWDPQTSFRGLWPFSGIQIVIRKQVWNRENQPLLVFRVPFTGAEQRPRHWQDDGG